MEKIDIDKLEELGYVSDSKKVRDELILLLNNKREDLEIVQEKLKEIKKSGKKRGLFTRDELYIKKYTLEEAIAIAEKKKITYAYKSLSKKLPNKNKQNKQKRLKI